MLKINKILDKRKIMIWKIIVLLCIIFLMMIKIFQFSWDYKIASYNAGKYDIDVQMYTSPGDCHYCVNVYKKGIWLRFPKWKTEYIRIKSLDQQKSELTFKLVTDSHAEISIKNSKTSEEYAKFDVYIEDNKFSYELN